MILGKRKLVEYDKSYGENALFQPWRSNKLFAVLPGKINDLFESDDFKAVDKDKVSREKKHI